MRLKQILPNIYFIKFPSQYEATMTMLRPQEFYESPYKNVRNKYFTLEQYMDRYAKTKGNFTYCTDWDGFNIPGNILVKFFLQFKGSLSQKEKKLLSKIWKFICDPERRVYIIGGYDDVVMHHEVAHGLFYTNEEYRKKTLMALKSMPKDFINRFKIALKKKGYCSKVYLDEIQAYCVDNIVQRENQLDSMSWHPKDKVCAKRIYYIFEEYFRQ